MNAGLSLVIRRFARDQTVRPRRTERKRWLFLRRARGTSASIRRWPWGTALRGRSGSMRYRARARRPHAARVGSCRNARALSSRSPCWCGSAQRRWRWQSSFSSWPYARSACGFSSAPVLLPSWPYSLSSPCGWHWLSPGAGVRESAVRRWSTATSVGTLDRTSFRGEGCRHSRRDLSKCGRRAAGSNAHSVAHAAPAQATMWVYAVVAAVCDPLRRAISAADSPRCRSAGRWWCDGRVALRDGRCRRWS